jgi:hypothetical protein
VTSPLRLARLPSARELGAGCGTWPSEEARFMTGITVVLDGGYTAL